MDSVNRALVITISLHYSSSGFCLLLLKLAGFHILICFMTRNKKLDRFTLPCSLETPVKSDSSECMHYLASASLSFVSCEMELIRIPISQACWEDQESSSASCEALSMTSGTEEVKIAMILPWFCSFWEVPGIWFYQLFYHKKQASLHPICLALEILKRATAPSRRTKKRYCNSNKKKLISSLPGGQTKALTHDDPRHAEKHGAEVEWRCQLAKLSAFYPNWQTACFCLVAHAPAFTPWPSLLR